MHHALTFLLHFLLTSIMPGMSRSAWGERKVFIQVLWMLPASLVYAPMTGKRGVPGNAFAGEGRNAVLLSRNRKKQKTFVFS